MANRPRVLQTLPADGLVAEEIIDDMREEYGYPATPQEYRLIVRIMCGQKAPTWVYTDPTNPVTRLDLIATDGGTREIVAPLPWDPDLLVHYQGMLSSLQKWLAASDGAGSTRAGSSPTSWPTVRRSATTRTPRWWS